MSIGKLKRTVSRLNRQLEMVRQNRTAGALTNVTTRGTNIRPIGGNFGGSTSTNNTNNVARWA